MQEQINDQVQEEKESDVFEQLGCRNRKERREMAKRIAKTKSFKNYQRGTKC